jgi:hypothetical protein
VPDDNGLRHQTATIAELMASSSERAAERLEMAALRGDRERRLATAEWERAVAAVLRRNAERLWDANGPLTLERLPPAPPHHEPSRELDRATLSVSPVHSTTANRSTVPDLH